MGNEQQWSAETTERWSQIRDWLCDDEPWSHRFRQQLAECTGWNARECEDGLEEYRRFALLATQRHGDVVPSAAVDKIWHLHLTYTREYWQRFCPQILGFEFHHQPALGRAGEASALRERYVDMLHAYAALFGPPSVLWWPEQPTARCLPRHSRVAVRRRWRLAHRLPGMLALLLAAPIAGAMPSNPLEWRGPEFLALYGAMLALCLLIGLIHRAWLRNALAPPAMALGDPDVWSIAFLAAGPPRLADAVVAALYQQGLVEWDASQRQLRVTEGASTTDPVLNTALTEVRRNTDVQLRRFLRSSAFSSVRKNVLQRGWWFDDERALRIAKSSALLPLLVALFGLTKIGIGIARDKPVGFLVVLTLIAAVITAVFYFKRPARTPAGTKALSELNSRHALAKRAPRTGDLALAVALAGTAVLSGTALAGYHQARSPTGSDGSSSSDSSSSDSGGDSGGGGGGCGGCGGD